MKSAPAKNTILQRDGFLYPQKPEIVEHRNISFLRNEDFTRRSSLPTYLRSATFYGVHYGRPKSDSSFNSSTATLAPPINSSELVNSLMASHKRRSSLIYAGSNQRVFQLRSDTAKHSNMSLEDQMRHRRYSVVIGTDEAKLKAKLKKHTKELLTAQQLIAFKEAFDLFDRSGGGSFNAKELQHCMEESGIEIKDSNIQDIMEKLDKKTNGVIDFVEFLDLLTNENLILNVYGTLKDGTKKESTKPLLYDVIIEFIKKSALQHAHEIFSYYDKQYKKLMNFNAKNPHVVGHYADGSRLIGLTERELLQKIRQMKTTQAENDGSGNSSPYTQPISEAVIRSVTSPEFTRINTSRPKSTKVTYYAPAIFNNIPSAASGDRNGSVKSEEAEPKVKTKRPQSELYGKPKPVSPIRVPKKKMGWAPQQSKIHDIDIPIPGPYRSYEATEVLSLRKKIADATAKYNAKVTRKKFKNLINHYEKLEPTIPLTPASYQAFQRVFSTYSSAEASNRGSVTTSDLRKVRQHLMMKQQRKLFDRQAMAA